MKIFATTAAMALTAGPLLAGGLEEPVVAPEPMAPVVAPAYESLWNGGYVGAQLGYGWANIEEGGGDGEGTVGGVHAGYLWNTDRFVYGLEGEYNAAAIEADDDDEDAEINSLLNLKAKAGYDLGRALVYATLGGVYGDAEFTGDDAQDWGIVGGVGMDYMVTDAVSVGGEVLYSYWDEFDNSDIEVDNTTATVKVAYHF